METKYVKVSFRPSSRTVLTGTPKGIFNTETEKYEIFTNVPVIMPKFDVSKATQEQVLGFYAEVLEFHYASPGHLLRFTVKGCQFGRSQNLTAKTGTGEPKKIKEGDVALRLVELMMTDSDIMDLMANGKKPEAMERARASLATTGNVKVDKAMSAAAVAEGRAIYKADLKAAGLDELDDEVYETT